MKGVNPMVFQNGFNANVVSFVEAVLEQANVNYHEAICVDFDLDRIYLTIDNTPYTIRMWNIDDTGIRFSVYKDTKTDTVELYHGFIAEY